MSKGPEDPADKDTSIWDKHDAMLNPKTGKKDRLLTLNFIQKYIQIAKTIKPTLSDEACELIGEEYSRYLNACIKKTIVKRRNFSRMTPGEIYTYFEANIFH